jgi:NitT/TauT family transport system ATP-binding protein
MNSFVSVRNVSMNYHSKSGETRAVRELSFDVARGEFISLVGPSGCGKSTLLSAVAGLIKPADGEILIDGGSACGQTAGVGYMLQRDCLFEWRTIYENAILGLELQKKLTPESRAYVERLFGLCGLCGFEGHKPSELSGGMRQRAALIRTLAAKPELLLLDEPFSALDYQTRLCIADEVGQILRKEGKTAILVTHDIAEAISFSNRVILLSKRPAEIKNIHTITFKTKNPTALEAREAPEFRTYFNAIWKELDVHAHV